MDARIKISLVGAAIGFLGAIGILFEPDEPYPGFVVLAGTLGGIVLGLLLSVVVTGGSSVRSAIGWGALMGLLHSTVVFLAKGGWSSMDAPYVIPTGIVSGLLLGPIVRWLPSSTKR